MIPALLACLALAQAPPQEAAWTPIFNGRNLDGWTAKITGYEFGENFADTYRVSGGAIQVSYDGYGGQFKGRFGHLFYRTPYSSYVLRLEYRFYGDQLPDGPGWAFCNSGIMFHCQDPKTLRKDQDFPVSLEMQLLGGNGKDPRSTGNICTPGTHIFYQGKLWTQHCTDSSSSTYHGDRWVKAEIEVRADGTILHRIEGQTVLEYGGAQLDPSDADAKRLLDSAKGESVLRSGWIALQSESSPCEFRKIEIRRL
ncbi:MAG: DUF1080 domain-containing protein [Armatimonadetes bacterium]|nr:DUF1080 domain-containing protein [Armatimonadota bacterium]NOG37926.1 DUF1080 domain-containing protein [Armatimonadota bacterium]GIK31813.1 MAG: hypothetical protein BroJett009_08050 [Armatimonadota bacterium]